MSDRPLSPVDVLILATHPSQSVVAGEAALEAGGAAIDAFTSDPEGAAGDAAEAVLGATGEAAEDIGGVAVDAVEGLGGGAALAAHGAVVVAEGAARVVYDVGGSLVDGAEDVGDEVVAWFEGDEPPEDRVTDSDGDGLTDWHERHVSGTDPSLWDSDRDGSNDGEEVGLGTNPWLEDSDDDGLFDGSEGVWGTNPLGSDSDGDGISDGLEVKVFGTSPTAVDSDGDGLSDLAEVRVYRTDPRQDDSDGDGLGDGTEVGEGFDPRLADSDGDGVGDLAEAQSGWMVAQVDPIDTTVVDPQRMVADVDGLSVADAIPLDPTDIPQVTDTMGYSEKPNEDAYEEGSQSQTGGLSPEGDALIEELVVEPAEQAAYHIGEVIVGAVGGAGEALVDAGDALVGVFEGDEPPEDRVTDSDGDGLTDWHERHVSGTDPSLWDSDRDGSNDGEEVGLGTNPWLEDSDDDGLFDGSEGVWGTNPLGSDSDGDGISDGLEVKVFGTSPTAVDSDGDGLSDLAEVRVYRTDPRQDDSDGDGLGDGTEVGEGFDPRLADSDGDGVGDLAEAQSGWMVAQVDPIDTTVVDPQRMVADVDGLSVADAIPLDPDAMPVTETPAFDEDGPLPNDRDAAVEIDLPVRILPPVAEADADAIAVPDVADTTLPDWVTEHDGVSEVEPAEPFDPGPGDVLGEVSVVEVAPQPFDPGAGDQMGETSVVDVVPAEPFDPGPGDLLGEVSVVDVAPQPFDPGPGDLGAIPVHVEPMNGSPFTPAPAGVPDLSRDSDGDGLTDFVERSYRTNPNDSDTDNDGISDGAEVRAGTDPLTPEGGTSSGGGVGGGGGGGGTTSLVADPIVADLGTPVDATDAAAPGVQETGIIIVGGTEPEAQVASFDEVPTAEVAAHEPLVWVDPLPEPLVDHHDAGLVVQDDVADLSVADHQLASFDDGFDVDAW